MSYAEIVLAIVPDAPPTRKNQRATSCPAPISANVPYLPGSRLICSAFWFVETISRVISGELSTKKSWRRACIFVAPLPGDFDSGDSAAVASHTSAVRFMGSLHSLLRMHWDHE